MRLALLGCGAVGAEVARQLGTNETISTMIIADKDSDLASKVAAEIGAKAVAQEVDATNPESLAKVLA